MKKIKPTMKRAAMLAVTFAATFSSGAHAVSLLGQAPDASLVVHAGGFEWVYAGPCAGAGVSCGPVALHHRFDFATDSQWNDSFASVSALSAAFKPGADVLCAARYFNTVHDHCDFGDIQAGYIWHSPLAGVGQRDASFAETFLVRAADAPVPEPASIALLGLGLAGLAATRRQRVN